MALKLFGHLGYGDLQTPFANPTVQAEFLNETQRLVDDYRADTAAQAGMLIDRTVEVPQMLYELHVSGGMFQQLGGHEVGHASWGCAHGGAGLG